MNVLLANMPISFNKRENLEPPLGVCYIAGMLKKRGFENVVIRDYEVEEFSADSLRKDLETIKPGMIGVSFRTASYRSAKEFIEQVKASGCGAFIVGGGHHATAFPEETLIDLRCDAVVRGEGEYVFYEIAERVEGGVELAGIPGVTYLSGSKVISNDDRPPIENIDELPWPARELLSLEKYNVLTILTSRGCPFNCIYCDKGVSTRKVKFRSPESIFNEISYISRKLKKNRLYIVDDHFFLNRNIVEPVLDRIINERLPVSWTCQSRVDGIFPDIMRKAAQAGCEQIMFGIETGDETIHKYIRKGASIARAEDAVRVTKSAGIKARANFMLGFPISTKDTIRNTVKFAKKIRPDIVRFFAVSPLPNTQLWDYIYGKGHIPGKIKWEELDFFRPSFDLWGISREELSLYVTAAYWHVLGRDFLLETTIFAVPNMARLLYLVMATGKLRGNISKCFPRSVNLIVDNLHHLSGKKPGGLLRFIGRVREIEKTFR